MVPKAYILVGVPGSGKTTWARRQRWISNCAYISTDKFVEEYAAETGSTYGEVFQGYMPTALDRMVEEVVQARSAGRDIIWDQTSTTEASRRRKFKMLPGYTHIAVVFPTPAPDVLRERLAGRPGKVVPHEVVQSMIQGWEPPTHFEGYQEIWYPGFDK